MLLLAVAACGGDEDNETRPASCELPAWRADNVCDVDRVCGHAEPDPGCFLAFDSPERAIDWYDSTYAREQRGPALTTDDPRHAPMQSILDEAWAHYKATHPVGTLADRRLQLVLLEEGKPNAFVSGDANTIKTGLAVMATASLVELGAPREQLMAVIAHEIEHAIGLHVVPTVSDRMRRFYIAPEGSEPLGFDQDDDLTARTFALDWMAYADSIGWLTDAELGGVPIEGDLAGAFRAITVGCSADVDAMYKAIGERLDRLDYSIVVDPALASLINTTMESLRGCFATESRDAIALVAEHFKISADKVRASLDDAYRTSIEGKNAIEGLANWVSLERAAMRDIEAQFTAAMGVPWTRLRYFSTEEAADDSSVYTMHASGFPADSLGRFVPVLGKVEEQCRPLVDTDAPIPYGEDIADEHHAPCWRAGHIKRVAAQVTPRMIAPAPFVVDEAPKQRLFPRRDLRVSH